MSEPTPPAFHEVSDLIRRSKEGSHQSLLALLGPFVLIGDGVFERPRTFKFVTVATDMRRQAQTLALKDSVVFGLRKRTERFPRVILVGRSRSNDITIRHLSVSKLHARLRELSMDGFVVEDASSRNGTFVGPNRVEGSATVRCGDVLRFGSRPLLVRRTDRLIRALRRIDP